MSDKGESLEDTQAAIAERNLHAQTGASTGKGGPSTPGSSAPAGSSASVGSSASAGSSLSAGSSALAGSSVPAGGNVSPVPGTSQSVGGHTGRGRRKAEESQVLTFINSFFFSYIYIDRQV